jgi:hypothetical protein
MGSIDRASYYGEWNALTFNFITNSVTQSSNVNQYMNISSG